MLQIIKGDFVYTKTKQQLEVARQSYMVVKEGKVEGIYSEVPKKYKDITIKEYKGKFIIPAFSDIHVHAPQYLQRGLGLDKELLPWLEQYTFPLESRYSDDEFARSSYKAFINKLWEVGSLRSVVFATKHKGSTKILADLFEKSGLKAYLGKVNMDRNTNENLREITQVSVDETIELVEEIATGFKNVKYIVTPRFVPVTTDQLMKQLGDIVEKYHLPVQSHLAENKKEVKWVKDLHPSINSFTEVYLEYGLLPIGRTVMAHCIYLSEEERQILKQRDILIAHCAQSNNNLASGIMPARKYMDEGLRIGMASDVGAGHQLQMNRHIVETIQASKLNWVNQRGEQPLSVVEAFYMATKENGSFWGKIGSFEPDYMFDALVIDKLNSELSLQQQLEQFIYLGDKRQISERIIEGEIIERPF